MNLDVKKRWRAWLRAIHRDFGYLAIGFTVIYAVSGIAQNHIEDWGDVSYRATERTLTIAAIPPSASDDAAIKAVADAAGLGTPTSALRAGDEVRLEYANNSKVTAIGTQVTIQTRERRAFIGLANWLHTARGKKAWKYISDVYAVLLLYLAISGVFMIKGRLGLKWRGTVLIGTGIAVPILYVALAGGPESQHSAPAKDTAVAGSPRAGSSPSEPVLKPLPAEGDDKPVLKPLPAEGDDKPVLKPLPPDDN